MNPHHGHLAFGPAPTAEVLALVADALAWPLLLLRRDGSLMHANRAARQMLRRGRPLALVASRLQARPAVHQAALDDALARAFAGEPHQVLHWPGCTATLGRLAAAAKGEAPVLLALAPAAGRDTATRAFAELHGLSEAEIRVLRRLAVGENSTRAAAALGVAPATVRSQTLSLRRKTGHASVAELLRALASLPPLAPPSGEGE